MHAVICIDKLHFLWQTLFFSPKFGFSLWLNLVFLSTPNCVKIWKVKRITLAHCSRCFKALHFACNIISVTPFSPPFVAFLNHFWLRMESVDNPLTASPSTYLMCFCFLFSVLFLLLKRVGSGNGSDWICAINLALVECF